MPGPLWHPPAPRAGKSSSFSRPAHARPSLISALFTPPRSPGALQRCPRCPAEAWCFASLSPEPRSPRAVTVATLSLHGVHAVSGLGFFMLKSRGGRGDRSHSTRGPRGRCGSLGHSGRAPVLLVSVLRAGQGFVLPPWESKGLLDSCGGGRWVEPPHPTLGRLCHCPYGSRARALSLTPGLSGTSVFPGSDVEGEVPGCRCVWA